MTGKIALITVVTDNVRAMAKFYNDVLQMPIADDRGQYVEFEHSGVRFAICARSILHNATGHQSYQEPGRGHAFELAFPCDTPEDVDKVYADIVAKGAAPVKAPALMPWGQKTAFFADPDGNIHELFADLPDQPK